MESSHIATPADQIEDGYSWNTYDDVFRTIVAGLNPKTVMDIGAGSGKYGKMTRKIAPDAKITAVEIDVEGTIRHKLDQTYDQVVTVQAADFLMKNPNENFDLVIIGDCIEHMPKSVGIDLLNYLNYRAAYVVIITPDGMVMNKDPYYLGHTSNWTERDFMWHDNFGYDRVGVMQLFLMRGLLRPELPDMGSMNEHIKAQALPLHLDNGQFYKNAEFTLVNQMFKWQNPNGSWGAYRPF